MRWLGSASSLRSVKHPEHLFEPLSHAEPNRPRREKAPVVIVDLTFQCRIVNFGGDERSELSSSPADCVRRFRPHVITDNILPCAVVEGPVLVEVASEKLPERS